MDSAIRDQLQHIYWIGGGSGAGKSTVARRIAAQHVLQLYATDDVMHDHARRTTREQAPLLHAFMAMDMDERWVNRSAVVMLETFHWFRGEAFELIIEDVLRLPRNPAIVVEGIRVLPGLVEPLIPSKANAVWLLPTPEFRQAAFEHRGEEASGFVARTSNPARALHNVLERDRMFTEVLRYETTRLGLSVIDVDSGTTENDVADRVTQLFRL